jgi:hypothetical protein
MTRPLLSPSSLTCFALRKCAGVAGIAGMLTLLPAVAYAQSSDTVQSDVANSVLEMFTKGKADVTLRSLYFSTHNGYFVKGENQDTIAYGAEVRFETARLYGFSLGASAFVQRDIGRSSNPDQVDTYLGPNLTGLGEAYVQWENKNFRITVGNQQLDLPFASTYDWRMVPQLYQGVFAKYGDSDNYISAFRILRFKSYIDNSFTQRTLYNAKVDPYSGVGDATTSGFWGAGGARTLKFAPANVVAQGWYFNYNDYGKMAYVQADATLNTAGLKPIFGIQYFRETGDGRNLAGSVDSNVFGAQLGVKRNSLTVALGYDYIKPHDGSFGNGALVTPYAHDVASGPMYAQPFLTSTQDLGAGNAYAIDISGAPFDGWFAGARYSFMDLKPSAGAHSIDQSEYLLYLIYNFSGKLKGLSVTDFFGYQTSPSEGSAKSFVQNRLQLEYKWGN